MRSTKKGCLSLVVLVTIAFFVYWILREQQYELSPPSLLQIDNDDNQHDAEEDHLISDGNTNTATSPSGDPIDKESRLVASVSPSPAHSTSSKPSSTAAVSTKSPTVVSSSTVASVEPPLRVFQFRHRRPLPKPSRNLTEVNILLWDYPWVSPPSLSDLIDAHLGCDGH